MSFKPENKTRSFSDLELSSQEDKNRSLHTLSLLNQAIEWGSIEKRLLKGYPIGKKKKGPHAYPPLMLFKSHLLRNWYQIKSDADLESLINDRFSFKKFIGLPIGDPAPASSTFSRFRQRLGFEKYESSLADISDQLSEKNIFINMGNTIDIRLNTPVS